VAVPIPEIEITGVAVIVSEKAAVMVTVCELFKRLSSSVSVKVTVGIVVLTVKVMVFDPA